MQTDRKLVWMRGPGCDGKTIFARVLTGALGDYAVALPAEAMVEGGRRGAHGHELVSGLPGARLAVASEVPSELDWPFLKAVSGGDVIASKRLHGRTYEVESNARLLCLSQQLPEFPYGDQAAADRLAFIQLRPPAEPDPSIAEALAKPGEQRRRCCAAALSWMLRGCREYLAEKSLTTSGDPQ
jgi:putative DNA primase/helicase